jgi:Uri superfamily endonuclease
MLTELKNIRQNPGENRRRWFSDEDLDLIVWQAESGRVSAFQLCYDKQRAEHALMWRSGQTLEHYRVDGGEPGPRQNLSPMMESAPLPQVGDVQDRFAARSADIDSDVRAQVLAVLEEERAPRVVILGEDVPGGVYLLRIRLETDCEVAFGRFRGGEALPLRAGEYVYIGSAHGARGAAAMANRLLRHATRSAGNPHRIREELALILSEAGLVGKLPSKKTVRWHIDYLLEQPEVEIIGVLAFRTTEKIEKRLAESLEADDHTTPITPGLGASDHPGHSHLLRFEGGDRFWSECAVKYSRIAPSKS